MLIMESKTNVRNPVPIWRKVDLRHRSWIPTEYRAQLSRNGGFLILIMEGRLYSLDVELLLELIAGHRDSMRLFKLEDPS